MVQPSENQSRAAGDVRYGSVKRVAPAVGEGAVAVQLMHQYLKTD